MILLIQFIFVMLFLGMMLSETLTWYSHYRNIPYKKYIKKWFNFTWKFLLSLDIIILLIILIL